MEKVIVRPDQTTVIYTGTTEYQFIGSGNTEISQTGGNPDVVTIYSPTGGTAEWGLISGTLSDQVDLQAELDAKTAPTDFVGSGGTTVSVSGTTVIIKSTVPTGSTVTWGEIVGDLDNQVDLQAELDLKLDIADYNIYTGATETTLSGLRTDVDIVSGATVTNAEAITGNTAYIDNVSGNTETNAADIATNVSDINDNYNLITGNTENIITNAADIDKIETLFVDQADPTGFIDNQNIGCSYNSTTRIVTLTHATGIVYYYNGVKYDLGTSWSSTAHPDTTVGYYLFSSDGTTFSWSTSPWTFNELMIAFRPEDTDMIIREMHGTMDWASHEEFHRTTGTYAVSGFGFTAGTYEVQPSSPTDANNTAGFEAGIVADEDLKTDIDAWIQNTYTTLTFSGTATYSMITDQSAYAVITGTYPNIYEFDGTNFSTTEMDNRRYANYYVIRIPVGSDATSQKYRAVVLSPQFQYGSLAAAQGEQPNEIEFGDLKDILAEMIMVERITIRTSNTYGTTGKFRIEAVAILKGTYFNQIAANGSVGGVTAGNVSVVPTSPFTSLNQQGWDDEATALLTGKTEQSDFTTHTGDTTIHFTQAQITGFTTTTDFDTYTGATDTTLTGLRSDIDTVSGDTADKQDKLADVNLFTGTTTINVNNNNSGQIIELSASAVTVSLNTGLNDGLQITFVNVGTGTVTFAAGGGITLRSKDNNVTLPNKYGAASAYFNSTDDTWTIFGDLE